MADQSLVDERPDLEWFRWYRMTVEPTESVAAGIHHRSRTCDFVFVCSVRKAPAWERSYRSYDD